MAELLGGAPYAPPPLPQYAFMLFYSYSKKLYLQKRSSGLICSIRNTEYEISRMRVMNHVPSSTDKWPFISLIGMYCRKGSDIFPPPPNKTSPTALYATVMKDPEMVLYVYRAF